MKSALITGATGAVGRHCLKMLLEDDSYNSVTVLSRRSLSIQHPKLREIIVNFENLLTIKEVFAVDNVFCCLGTTMKKAGSKEAFMKVDYEYPLKIASLASEMGARQLLMVTAIGANANSSIFYNRVKGEIENEIKTLKIDSILFFRPSLLLGERDEFRLGERLAGFLFRFIGFIFLGPLAVYRAVQTEAVAFAMIHSARQNLKGVRVIKSDQIRSLIKKKLETKV